MRMVQGGGVRLAACQSAHLCCVASQLCSPIDREKLHAETGCQSTQGAQGIVESALFCKIIGSGGEFPFPD